MGEPHGEREASGPCERICEKCGDTFEAPTDEAVWAYCGACLMASLRLLNIP